MTAHLDIPASCLREHPAVRAWRSLRPDCGEPEEIVVLKRRKKTRRSAVYRLRGVGPEGSAVIAKCRLWKHLVVERMIYEEVVPRLPEPSLRLYGVSQDEDEYAWLFVEDAGTEEYSIEREEHRQLAARWLAAVHEVTRDGALAGRLPDRGPAHYHEHLCFARDTICENLSNPALTEEDRSVLQALLAQLHRVERCWNEISRFCDRRPRVLVHGDLVEKNVRVRETRSGLAFLPFDWETAGWGVPAADLVQHSGHFVSPDLAVYRSLIDRVWPHVLSSDLNWLAEVGRVFRVLAAISWESRSLPYGEVEKPMVNMRAYAARMAKALTAAEWDG